MEEGRRKQSLPSQTFWMMGSSLAVTRSMQESTRASGHRLARRLSYTRLKKFKRPTSTLHFGVDPSIHQSIHDTEDNQSTGTCWRRLSFILRPKKGKKIHRQSLCLLRNRTGGLDHVDERDGLQHLPAAASFNTDSLGPTSVGIRSTSSATLLLVLLNKHNKQCREMERTFPRKL